MQEKSTIKQINEFSIKKSIQFQDSLDTLSGFGCTYLSVTVEEDVSRTHFFSNNQWLSVFINEGFINNCQLSTLARQKNLIIPWDSISSTEKHIQQVMEARLDHDIAHGLTLSKKTNKHIIMVALGTNKGNTNFISSLIDHQMFLKKTLGEISQIVFERES
ncbi:MAG: hypothetical protein HKM04_05285 [Legionellales bacterium]|nr:hypothetical protein [Legionellales bacterium]